MNYTTGNVLQEACQDNILYLNDLNQTIVINDIQNRYRIRKTELFRRLVNYILISNARIFSANSILQPVPDRTESSWSCHLSSGDNTLPALPSASSSRMDPDISQNPAYLYRTTFGKYQNFCIAYIPDYYKTYAEVQEADDLDQAFRDFLLTAACDCMNEKACMWK